MAKLIINGVEMEHADITISINTNERPKTADDPAPPSGGGGSDPPPPPPHDR